MQCKRSGVLDEDIALFNAWYTAFGDSRAGLIDAPFWMFQLKHIHDQAHSDKLRREADKQRQSDIFAQHFGGRK